METVYSPLTNEQVNKEKHAHMLSMHTQWNLLSLKKEGNPAICDSMDEAGRHYAE